MDVQIGEINSTVRAVDGQSLLTPQLLNEIIRAVMAEMEARSLHDRRVRAEQRVTGGVRQEMEGEQ
jgi:hypothetical protein